MGNIERSCVIIRPSLLVKGEVLKKMNSLVHGLLIVLLLFAMDLYVQPVRTGSIIVFSNRLVNPMRISGVIFFVRRSQFLVLNASEMVCKVRTVAVTLTVTGLVTVCLKTASASN